MPSFTRLHTAAIAGLSVLALTSIGTGSAAALSSHPSTARTDGAAYTAGAPGSGDPYFPYDGNGGYDVLHYDLALRYTPPTDPAALVGKLTGVATITLRAKQNLQSLNFDLRGLDVTSVRVDGKAETHGKSAGTGSAEWSQTQDDEVSRDRQPGGYLGEERLTVHGEMADAGEQEEGPQRHPEDGAKHGRALLLRCEEVHAAAFVGRFAGRSDVPTLH